MRDVALLGINPGMCTAFLDRGRGRLACAACLGNLSESALTIPGASAKNNQNNAVHGSKDIIIMTTRHRQRAMRHGEHGVAWHGMSGGGHACRAEGRNVD